MTLPILKTSIKRALLQEQGNVGEVANTVSTAIANQIGDAIDAYIQEQIGLRLQLLPTSFNCAAPGSAVVTTPIFATMTRTLNF